MIIFMALQKSSNNFLLWTVNVFKDLVRISQRYFNPLTAGISVMPCISQSAVKGLKFSQQFLFISLSAIFGCCFRSLGCTVVEMLSGNPPWHEFEGIAAIYRIATSAQPEYQLPAGTSKLAQNFLNQCFVKDFSRRPQAKELLRDAFVKAYT